MNRVRRNEDTIRWKGSIPIYFTYTVGKSGEVFFKNLKEKNVLTASECPECGVRYFPARIYCERCMADIEKFLEVPKEGEVEGITEVYIDVEERRLSSPIKLALVKVRGTDGKVVLHALEAVNPGDFVKIIVKDGKIKGVKR